MHIRKDSSKPTTTVSLHQSTLSKVEDYRFNERKDNRSQAFEELILFGLKYKELLEKKKAKRLLSEC
ncbi:hypothetical protein ABE28_008825 [Peribacillus muralis]|uniref:Uncharacterized protein n=1 Tax=Peribacillus muralis TaxID=264697 RepID=A0A1B3XMJ8_9BACI|nr:hypothetical protein [Peribacillus muralis]AOH54454.1 hypothetical protein ABE28_008825 [Peribacillus muralis]